MEGSHCSSFFFSFFPFFFPPFFLSFYFLFLFFSFLSLLFSPLRVHGIGCVTARRNFETRRLQPPQRRTSRRQGKFSKEEKKKKSATVAGGTDGPPSVSVGLSWVVVVWCGKAESKVSRLSTSSGTSTAPVTS